MVFITATETVTKTDVILGCNLSPRLIVYILLVNIKVQQLQLWDMTHRILCRGSTEGAISHTITLASLPFSPQRRLLRGQITWSSDFNACGLS